MRRSAPKPSTPAVMAVVGAALTAIACGEHMPSRAQAAEPAQERAPEPQRDPRRTPDPAASPAPAAPAPVHEERAAVSDAALPQGPFPVPGGDLSLRGAYEQTQAEIVILSNLLGEKNREVVARYGRNDTPEALRVLTPIRDRLQRGRQHLDQLTCRSQPVGNVKDEFTRRKIPLDRFRVDGRWVAAYIAAKLADGDISAAEADDLSFVISKSGHGVMNPSSRGAHTINQRIVQALACFGLSGPPRSPMKLPPKQTPPPQPAPISRFRFFRTCGDAVCRSYRGPSPGIPRCRDESEGAPCSQPGAKCDLANNCNMLLVCADQDPATRCPR